MKQILVRFNIVKDEYVFETILDNRLSFIDNFKLLSNIIDIDISNYRVYDPNKKVFLDLNTSLDKFNISNFILLYLF